MRNLVTVRRVFLDVSHQSLPLENVAVDDDGIFCAFSDGGKILLRRNEAGKWSDHPTWPGDHILSIQPDNKNEAIVVLRSGSIVRSTEQGATIIGSFDETIEAAQWSPDGEVLSISTSNQIVFLSRTLDMISSYKYTAEDLELSKSVSVGWGSRETQFEGKGAHAVRDREAKFNPDSGCLAPEDAHEVFMSWRGDGEYVAVNSVTQVSPARRVIRIFTRDGQLSSVTEPVDNLISPVSWKPSGEVITAVCCDPPQLVFFERNGLVRYKVKLDRVPRNISWSSDSEILAVLFHDSVELWIMRNWHWYKKQTIPATCGIGSLVWHPVLQTLILPTTTTIEFHSLVSLVAAGSSTVPHDEGVVAVIDNNALGVTPFRRANVPPPISLFSLPCEANHVAISPDNLRIIICTTHEFQLYDMDLKGKFTLVETLPSDGLPRQASLTDKNIITLSDSSNGSVLMVNGQKQEITDNIALLKNRHYMTVGGDVMNIGGSLVAHLLKPCIDFVVTHSLAFGLTRNGELLCGGDIIARGVTSIMATHDYLIYTKLTELCFLHVEKPTQVPERGSEQSRPIERGSVLVTIIPRKMAVVLQAPRGNLETVYPRIFVLSAVRKHISKMDYRSAFDICKTHRIDLNILYDHYTEQFLANLKTFTASFNTNELDLFLTSLKNEDVTKTMYLDSFMDTQSAGNDTTSAEPKKYGLEKEKVNFVCGVLIPFLPEKSLVTAHACKTPPELENALANCKSEETVKHLCYLTDVDTLYKVALSMYDLKLALMVAEESQMDPKEYISFLRSREQDSPARCKFEINDYLKNWHRALVALVEIENISDQEVIDYVNAHQLHAEALPLIENSATLRHGVLLSQAQIWMDRGEYAKAGVNFESLGCKTEALDAYIKAGLWRRALSIDVKVASSLALSLEEQGCYSDAGEIYAHILSSYDKAVSCFCKAYRCDDAILAASMSSKQLDLELDGGLRACFGVLRETLAECAAQVHSQLRRLRDIRKLRETDPLGHKDPNQNISDNVSIATQSTHASFMTRYTDKSDQTTRTGVSRRTQKNRRREERKRARGKKGSVYEEEYLINSTGRLIERLTKIRPDTQNVVLALRRRGMHPYSRELVAAYLDVLGILEANLEEIYAVSDADLIRYDEKGLQYKANCPVPPPLPSPVNLD